MKKIFFLLTVLLFAFYACDKEYVEKPARLIKEKQMIDMMVDMHLAEATFSQVRYDSIWRNSSSANFYYSILKKYNVPDTLFEKSYIYYASNPRNFETMYRKVVNKLTEIELNNSGKKKDKLNVNPTLTE